MSNGDVLKRTHGQFSYLKCMIMCSMKKKWKREKKTTKRRQEEKKCFHFFNHQVRTGHGF